ncbi:MAG: hypothetical protein GY774_35975 [Planctomycetes bacterium]|nr:hypothetical protein [Planctomycetota bacterium]
MTIVVVLATSIVLYGSFWLKQKRTHSLRVEQAIKRIEVTLLADPNYIVTERIVIKAKEPNFFDLDYLINQSLQVCVSKGIRKGPPGWGIQLDKMFKRFPNFLRPNQDLYLYSTEYNWIGITAVEPTEEDLQKLKEQVMSLRISNDIRIAFSPFYPDRQRMQRELLEDQGKFN